MTIVMLAINGIINKLHQLYLAYTEIFLS